MHAGIHRPPGRHLPGQVPSGQTPPPPPEGHCSETVRILLECFLVLLHCRYNSDTIKYIKLQTCICMNISGWRYISHQTARIISEFLTHLLTETVGQLNQLKFYVQYRIYFNSFLKLFTILTATCRSIWRGHGPRWTWSTTSGIRLIREWTLRTWVAVVTVFLINVTTSRTHWKGFEST